MSIRKLFKGAKTKAMIVLGSFAMLLGVGASVSVATAVKENEVVETKAASNWAAGQTIYFTCWSGFFSDGAGPYVNYQHSGGWAGGLPASKTSQGDETIYYYTFANAPTTIQIQRKGDGGSGTWHNQWEPAISHSQNLYRITGWDSASYASASITQFYFKTPSNGSVTITPKDSSSTTKSTLSTNTLYFLYSDWTVSYSATGNTGYDFDYWTYSSSQSGTYSKWGSNATTNPMNNMSTGSDLYHSAVFKSKTYTITYHQNDGTGHTVTQSKTYGVTYTIPSLATLGMGASTGRCFLRWDTDEHGEGTSYSEGSTYTTNAALNLYMIQDWYKYEYSADGGSSWVAVDSLLDTPTSGYIGELVTSSTHALTSGSSLTFRKYYGSGSHTNVSINAFSGNYGDGAIKFNYTGNVAVRVASNGNLDVHVDGYTDRQIFVNSTPYGLYFSGNTDGYTNVPVALYPGDVIRGGYNGGSYMARLTAGDGDFSGGDGENEVVCNAPGVFTIHLLSYDSGANFPNVRFDMDNSGSANLFAQTFNSAISTICTNITGSGAAATTLTTPWATQKGYYASLTDGAKALITPSGASPAVTDIDKCIEKYDYVCGKYGTKGQNILGANPDFLGRDPAVPSSALVLGGPSSDQSPLTLTLWIVLGAGVLGLGAIGTAYFVSKKKKRHQA